MRPLALAFVTALLLAGCSDPASPEDAPPASTPAPSAPEPTQAPPSAPPAAPPQENRAPVARLSSNATSGQVPLHVQFTLDAEDPDGDALSYRFAPEGSAPETFSSATSLDHVFTVAGTYVARLVVSDGTLENEATVSISALTPAAAAALPPPLQFTGTVSGFCGYPDEVAAVAESDCLPGAVQHNVSMPAAVTSLNITLAWTSQAPAVMDLDMYVYDETGGLVAEAECTNIDPLPNPEVPTLGPFFTCVDGYRENALITGISLSADTTWTILVYPYQAYEVPYVLDVHYG